MINGAAAEPLRGGPSSVQKKKKRNKKNKKKTAADDGNESDSSNGSDELNFFATGGGTSSSIVSHARAKKPAAAANGQTAAAAVPAHQLSAFQEGLLADPIEVVVKDVLAVTKGDFTASAIRDCVGRMFDSEQNYDKTDAVVKQLRIERGDVIKEDKPSASATPAAAPSTAANAETAKDTQQQQEPAAAKPPAKITSMRAAGGAAATATAAAPPPPLTSFNRPGANDSSGVHALPMGNKLEVAARHEPLSAGLEALCSWAHIVGVDSAPAQFFAADCRAAELVMQSLVNDPSQLAVGGKTRDNLIALLQKLFVVRTAPPSNRLVLSLLADIEAVLRKVQSARASSGMQLLMPNGTAAKTLADNLGALLRRLNQTMHPASDEEEAVSKTKDEVIAEAVAALEKEAKALAARAPRLSAEQAKEKSPATLKQLVAARDAHHEIVGIRKQISELVAQANDPAASNGGAVLAKARQVSNKSSKHEVKIISADELANGILADVGESATTLSMKKAQAAAAQSDLMTAGSSSSQSAAKLQEIKMCDEKLSDFLIQKSNLENQLAALERDITLVTSRRDVLRNEYVSVSSQQHDKMSRLAAAKAETERTDMLESTVRSVTSTYSALDRNVRAVEEELCAIMLTSNGSEQTSASTGSTFCAATDASVSRDAFCNYVSSEVACIESLAGRVVDLRQKQLGKNREILEYERIGIAALVEELRRDQEKLGADCSEDINAIRALQECLVEVIKSTLTPIDLIKADQEGDASVWAAPRRVVGELKTVLRAANLPLHPVLDKFGIGAIPAVSPKTEPAPVLPAAPQNDSSAPKKAAPVKTPSKTASPWGANAKTAASASQNESAAAPAPEVAPAPVSTDPTPAQVPLPKRGARSARSLKKTEEDDKNNAGPTPV